MPKVRALKRRTRSRRPVPSPRPLRGEGQDEGPGAERAANPQALTLTLSRSPRESGKAPSFQDYAAAPGSAHFCPTEISCQDSVFHIKLIVMGLSEARTTSGAYQLPCRDPEATAPAFETIGAPVIGTRPTCMDRHVATFLAKTEPRPRRHAGLRLAPQGVEKARIGVANGEATRLWAPAAVVASVA